MATVGHVHGRFQPFHEGHLRYTKWAADNCDELIVGITNADPSHITVEDADPKRHKEHNNPFYYHERQRVVRRAVERSSIDVPVRVAPFPINRPKLWDYYAPRDVVHFVFVLEDWHEVKADRLEQRGREVETFRTDRAISATEVRDRMARRDGWREHLPQGAVEVLEAIDGPERVHRLYARSDSD